MITLKEAEALGRADRITMTPQECDNIAESLVENYGASGVVVAEAYRKGAGI